MATEPGVRPRVPTRVLVVAAGLVAVLLLAAVVAGWLLTRQPALPVVPIPSRSVL